MPRYSVVLGLVVSIAAVTCGQEMRPEPKIGPTLAAAGGVCGTGGSCCVPGGRACNDVTCCTIVCGMDAFCCEEAWDSVCVAAAENKCGDLCTITKLCPGVGDCCAKHPEGGCSDEFCCNRVCSVIPSCCEVAWGPECVAEASTACSQCDTRPACPREGDCCFNNEPGRGCERVACCELVCELDDYCCDTAWDDECGAKARQFCPNVCVCETFGDFDDSGTINLLDFAALQICFSGEYPNYVGPGCECADYDGDDDSDILDFAHFGQ